MTPDNLVALCLEHHDDYDTKRSQSKGIKANEIKHWRSELDKVWQQSDEQLQITITGFGGLEGSGEKQIVRPSARLLGEVLNALDDDMLRSHQSRTWTGQPTGVKLARLGQRAIVEEGDLDVALEAFMSLLRLSVAAPTWSSGGMSLHQRRPMLTPALSTIDLLQTMRRDFRVVFEAARRAHIYALIGDESPSTLAVYAQMPHNAWQTVVDIIYHDTKFGLVKAQEGYSGGYLMSCLIELLVGLGIVYVSRGLTLPNPPHEIRITAANIRGIEPGQDEQVHPYLYIANKIAMLPEGDFKFALDKLKFYRHPVSNIIIDSKNDRCLDLQEALEEIRGWTIRPGFTSTSVFVDNEDAERVCLKLIHEAQQIGQQVVNSSRAFLAAERECAIKQRYFRERSTTPHGMEIDMETDTISFGL